MIRAAYLLDPAEAGAAMAELISVGVPWGPSDARAQVLSREPISDTLAKVTIGFPAEYWGDDVTLLLATAVMGEMGDRAELATCRLVDLDVPAGLLPGPAFTAPDRLLVGATLAPAMGTSPAELASVAADLVRGGVDVIVDPLAVADPPWCLLEQRVARVAANVPDDVPYFVNVTGNAGNVMHRAATAVDMGAGGLVINAAVQGLDIVRVLREADLGVPVLAHRAGFAPWLRSEHFGMAPAVLARLLRLVGADVVMCGAIDGTRSGSADDVTAQVAACRGALEDGAVPASVAVLDGGLGPANAAAQVERLGGDGLLVLLDADAYSAPGGIEAAVRGTVEALDV